MLNSNQKRAPRWIGVLLLAGFSSTAWADDPPTCALYTTKMDFGAYNRVNHSHAAGTVTVSCTSAADLRLHLDGGLNGTIPNRKLRHSNGSAASNYNMDYQMYLDAARTQVWGDGTIGAVKHISGTSSTSYIYGRLFAGQNHVLPGEYSDSVNVSLIY